MANGTVRQGVQYLTLTIGDVITVTSGATGSSGVLYVYDQSAGQQPSAYSTSVAANSSVKVGPYTTTMTVLVQVDAGSLDYVTSRFSIANAIGGPFTVISAARALQPADNGTLFRYEGSGALALTVPANLPDGFNIVILQYGTGVVTPTAGTGATKRGSGSTTAQYAPTTVLVIRNPTGLAAEFVVLGGA